MSDDDNNSIDSDDDLKLKLNLDIKQINNAWRTEIHCPEILLYRDKLVRGLSEKMRRLENEINDNTESTRDNPDGMFTLVISQMDVERVKFSLSRYLRARLMKLEEQVYAISNDRDMFDRLSSPEKKFLNDLKEQYDNYLEDTVYKFLDSKEWESENYMKKHSTPNLDERVFYQELNGDDPELIKLGKYSKVRDEVLRGETILL